MSGIFGVFNRNGKVVEKETVNTMIKATSYWRADEKNTWINGPVVLGHTMLWNTPESKYEHLPLEADAYVLTMDARIDNRDELKKELELPDLPVEEIGDSEFILAAYQKWGEDCSKYLLGDFTFVIWDEKKKQLFCTRDHIGIKQFYYFLENGMFVFSNDIKSLMNFGIIPKEINDNAVVNQMVYAHLQSSSYTFYKNVFKLPPAHNLIITHEKVIKKPYWKITNSPKVTYTNIDECAEKLRHLITQSIYDRMRSIYPITSHLSGGIDSSSIAAIASRKLRKNNQTLLAFNWLHEPSDKDDPNYYEWANSKTIAELEGIEHHYVSLNARDIYDYMKNNKISDGDSAQFWYEVPIRKHANSKGSRTILSGWGGDDFASYPGASYFSNIFLEGKILELIKAEKHYACSKSQEKCIRRFIGSIYKWVVIPLVPRFLYCYMPRTHCSEIRENATTFIKKEYLSSVKNELNQYFKYNNVLQPQSTIRKSMIADYKFGHLQARIESWSAASKIDRLEYAYPLLDKRIVEFMMQVPTKFFVHEGKGRYLFRSAMKNIVPEHILWSNTKYERKRVDELSLLLNQVFEIYTNNYGIKTSKYINTEKLYKAFKELKSFGDNNNEIIDYTVKYLTILLLDRE
ncbi:MAG: hypothetical protein GQ531_11540 [Sulfurovum sp.]|nr:hypothetical protein [Sulfurovum sp.]